jgi:hypothetical protein
VTCVRRFTCHPRSQSRDPECDRPPWTPLDKNDYGPQQYISTIMHHVLFSLFLCLEHCSSWISRRRSDLIPCHHPASAKPQPLQMPVSAPHPRNAGFYIASNVTESLPSPNAGVGRSLKKRQRLPLNLPSLQMHCTLDPAPTWRL